MARGKHAHRKANRDNRALQDEVARLKVEITAANAELTETEKEARERADLRERLRRCVADRDAAVADERVRLDSDEQTLKSVYRITRDATDRLNKLWEAYGDAYMEADGGPSKEAVERLLEVVSDKEAGHIYLRDAPTGAASAEAMVRIEKARGQRKLGYIKPKSRMFAGAVPLAPRAIRAELDEWLSTDSAHDVEETPPEPVSNLIREWRSATLNTLSPIAALAGHPHPHVDTAIDPEHPVARLLGVDFSGPELPSPCTEAPRLDALLSDRAWHAMRDPWQAADRLLPLWRLGRDILRDGGRVVTPLQPMPRHPSPADAVALRHWYSLAAAGAWARNDLDDTAAGYGEVAVGLAVASTYWMPPGQVRGYLDSDPISPSDRATIRLSYPNVFLALGKPIVLSPIDPGVELSRIEILEMNALRLSRTTADGNNPRSWVLHDLRAVNAINLLDLIAARGALVEGILMLAEHEGIPSGRIAWCVAIPARVGVLGRWVIPAHRDRTAYADEVDALMAVAAWADWHPPADPEIDTAANHSRTASLQKAAARGQVHVLNAARTASASEASRPTGRTVAAHLRRGHWRRQRVGPGRTETRMVRVSPAVVGAGSRPMTTGIYRLPTNPSAKEVASSGSAREPTSNPKGNDDGITQISSPGRG